VKRAQANTKGFNPDLTLPYALRKDHFAVAAGVAQWQVS
jgi:hypothetical protein